MLKSLWKKKNASAASTASSLATESAQPDSAKPRDWTDELSDEERDRIVEKVAQGVVKRGMDTPAILFMEMHKPVSFFASQSLVILSPFTAPFIGMDNVQVASKLMEKRENVELLIRRIEELAVERDAAQRSAKRQAKARGTEAPPPDPSVTDPV